MTEAENEYVIRGNYALVKCKIPSFVADFVNIMSWVDNTNNIYRPGNNFGKWFINLIM